MYDVFKRFSMINLKFEISHQYIIIVYTKYYIQQI